MSSAPFLEIIFSMTNGYDFKFCEYDEAKAQEVLSSVNRRKFLLKSNSLFQANHPLQEL